MSKKPSPILICVVLAVITIAVFWPVIGHQFISYDDVDFVTGNPHVRTGFTAENIKWAFTNGQVANWYPLTWLSHMLDWRVFGPNPSGHHAVNLLLHLLNVILLFLLLIRLTGAHWRSAFVAALFAIHPLSVEPVAWVSERKDVLSACFLLLTLWAYVGYVRHSSIGRYLAVAGLFALGLMSKPSLVTLPFALLLLDYWPLRRTGVKRLILEKVPLLALSAASSVITYLAQAKTVGVTSCYPLGVRAANALVAYVAYIGKTFWPARLVYPYPHPANTLPVWQVIGSAFLLALISAGAILYAKRRPYLAVGWFWYLGTLVPMIGLVQVGGGGQAMADRYAYVPLIGLFIALTWGGSEIIGRRKRIIPIIAGLIVLPLMAVSWIQVGYWRDAKTLAQRALAVTTDNYLAHYALGVTLAGEGDNEGAISHLSEAISLHLAYPEARYNMAVCLANEGRLDESISEYREAIRLRPDYAEAHNNLAVALYYRRDFPESWKEVHLAQQFGYAPNPDFLALLSTSMPEPFD